MEKRRLEKSLSVLISVHLWLYWTVTGNAADRLDSLRRRRGRRSEAEFAMPYGAAVFGNGNSCGE